MKVTFRRTRSRRLYFSIIFVALLNHSNVVAQPPAPPSQTPPSRQTPHRYILNYPVAEHFCPPVQTLFAEVAGRRTRRSNVQQHPNGGYGLAMIKKGNVSLKHTGADYAWFAVGDPVFAVADGVVRYSADGVRAQIKDQDLKIRLPAQAMDFGSMIIIEHRLPDGDSFTTVYAHLDNNRPVHTGDIVMAGQLIGHIGRKSPLINGGYEPHLHFGVRTTLMGRHGMPFMQIPIGGKPELIKVDEVGETTTSLLVPPGTPDRFLAVHEGVPLPIVRENDKYLMPSWPLWRIVIAEAKVHGYAASLEGWTDPTAFLRSKRADSFPAPHFAPTYRGRDNWIANTAGQKAQPWEVTEWLRPMRDQADDIQDLEKKIVCIVFVQATCETSTLACGPPLKQLNDRFPSGNDVQLVVLQTPFKTSARNSVSAFDRMTKHLPHDIALGHCEPTDDQPATIVERYGVEATPWTIIIGHDGVIEHSSCAIRPEEAIKIIERLQVSAQSTAQQSGNDR